VPETTPIGMIVGICVAVVVVIAVAIVVVIFLRRQNSKAPSVYVVFVSLTLGNTINAINTLHQICLNSY